MGWFFRLGDAPQSRVQASEDPGAPLGLSGFSRDEIVTLLDLRHIAYPQEVFCDVSGLDVRRMRFLLWLIAHGHLNEWTET